jgi:group I intron endonuclease
MTTVPQITGIYGLYCVCAECRRTGKTYVRYVGQAVDIHRRLPRHKAKSKAKSTNLCASWVKSHGWDNIRYLILAECDSSLLDSLEIYWIRQCDTYAPTSSRGGKNMQLGGASGSGATWTLTAEQRANQSKAARRRWEDEEYASKLRAISKDKTRRAEHSARTQALWEDPAYRAKHTAAIQNVRRSEKARIRQGEITQKLWQNPEIRARRAESITHGRWHVTQRRFDASCTRCVQDASEWT